MGLKFFKTVNASTRNLVLVKNDDLTKTVRPIKRLTKGKKTSSGRNNVGRITAKYMGGGHKRSLRKIDFKRSDSDVAKVVSIEYDPNRNARICRLCSDENGLEYYILAPDKISVGSIVKSGRNLDLFPGYCMPLTDIPSGISVHNIEMTPGKGGQIARAAGSSATVMGRHGKYTLVKLSSGEIRYILSLCRATIGSVSNPDFKNISISKAGRNRWLNKRPTVRAVAMNPVDHPHGGGEGKTSGGRHPVNRKGFSAKGKRTRKVNRYSNKFIKTKRYES